MSQRDSKSLVHGAVDGLAFPVHVVIVVWFHCMYRPFLVIVINDLDVGVKRSFAPYDTRIATCFALPQSSKHS